LPELRKENRMGSLEDTDVVKTVEKLCHVLWQRMLRIEHVPNKYLIIILLFIDGCVVYINTGPNEIINLSFPFPVTTIVFDRYGKTFMQKIPNK
jgi:hypothetical protein